MHTVLVNRALGSSVGVSIDGVSKCCMVAITRATGTGWRRKCICATRYHHRVVPVACWWLALYLSPLSDCDKFWHWAVWLYMYIFARCVPNGFIDIWNKYLRRRNADKTVPRGFNNTPSV